MLFSVDQNNDCSPLWHNFSTVCLELIVDAPFLYDLLKSDVFDWEENDQIYRRANNDCSLGIFQGFISELMYQQQRLEMSTYSHNYAFYPGRLSDKMLAKFKQQFHDQGYQNMKNYRILFPSLSFVYSSIYNAEVFLKREFDSTKAPAAIFEIEFTAKEKSGFLCYRDITMNETDKNMYVVNRL